MTPPRLPPDMPGELPGCLPPACYVTTPITAIFRNFGDAVYFADDETAFVREGNFIDPFVTGLKGQGLFFDLTAD